jgi:hypothetical protein
MSHFPNVHRRTFLRGVGTAMALPLLDAMNPVRSAFAAQAAPRGPVRMAFVFFPNGVIQKDWRVDGIEAVGSLKCTGRSLAPLCDFEQDLLFLEGLAQHHGEANGDGAGDHARNASVYLTGAQPFKTSGGNIKVGTSVDQAAAAEIGNRTRLGSLELGTVQGRNAGGCDSGYSCAYSSNISWKTPSTPTAKEINPKLVFERLFGSSNDREAKAARAKRDLYRQSILDLVANDAANLNRELGQTDRRKLDEYFTSVRELEQRIEKAAAGGPIEVPDFDLPSGVPRDHGQHVDLMYDLLALAFQTDSTRIATFMLENAGANRSYPEAGVNAGWHSLSHHQNNAEKMTQIQKIDEWYVKRFARFLGTLQATKEGEGTLLDNSMIVYGSGISDANRHRHNDLPILLAGKGGGSLATGRKLVYGRDTPLNNLFVSMTDRMGCSLGILGDSKGRLDNLI